MSIPRKTRTSNQNREVQNIESQEKLEQDCGAMLKAEAFNENISISESFKIHIEHCRACLLSSQNIMLPLKHHVEKLKDCTSVEVDMNDMDLPQKICLKCVEKLNSAYYFKKQVLHADYLLRSGHNPSDQVKENIVIIKKECNENELHDDNEHFSEFIENASLERSITSNDSSDFKKFEPEVEITEVIQVTKKRKTNKVNDNSNVFSANQEPKLNSEILIERRPKRKYTKRRVKVKVENDDPDFKLNSDESSLSDNEDDDDEDELLSRIKSKKKKVQNKLENVKVKRKYTKRKLKENIDNDSTAIVEEDIKKVKQKMRRRSDSQLCSVCGAFFSTWAKCQKHIKRHITPKKFCCHLCGEFINERRRVHHLRVHEGVKKYTCTICDRSFLLSKHLKRHMMSHTGERPYKCSECPRSFATGWNLKQHFRLHTMEKPYKCTECGNAFRHNVTLKAHVKSSHLKPLS